MSFSVYLVKKVMPGLLLQAARALKGQVWRLMHPQPVQSISLEDQLPWCSPDVWQRIVDFYIARSSPIVFEYGTGGSSIHHIRNLMAEGGTYIGVEHKPDKYAQVLDIVMNYAVQQGVTMELYSSSTLMPPDFPVDAYEAVFRLSSQGIAGCNVNLKLRPPHNRTHDGDSTLEEFREYSYALNRSCDVIIVDGRARKACVNYVLDHGLLKLGGLLVLFEAGRGVEGWLGGPALTGTSNYQPEVQRNVGFGR